MLLKIKEKTKSFAREILTIVKVVAFYIGFALSCCKIVWQYYLTPLLRWVAKKIYSKTLKPFGIAAHRSAWFIRQNTILATDRFISLPITQYWLVKLTPATNFIIKYAKPSVKLLKDVITVVIHVVKKLKPLFQQIGKTPKGIKTGVKLAMSNRDYRLFAMVYFVQGILGLSGLAFTLFLDGTMKLSVAQITTLGSITTIPWVIKPLYGMISDSYPLFKGLRRKPYIFICCLLASFGWFVLIKGAFAKSYAMILTGMIMEAVGVAMTDVVIDGLAVQKSPNEDEAKNIQTVCWGSRTVGALIAGFAGGWLLEHCTGWPLYNQFINVFFITMFLPLIPLLVAFFVDEEPIKKEEKVGMGRSFKVLGHAIATEKRLLIAALFIFLWNMTPSFGTPYLLFMKKQLGFSETFIGTLSTISSIGSLLGAMVYGLYLKSTTLKKILKWTIWIGAASTLLMFLVLNQMSAVIVWLVSGIIGYVSFIPTMALATRATPKGAEASVYALLMSIANFGGMVSMFIGGQLYEFIGLKALIILSAIACLVPLFVLKYLDENKGEGEKTDRIIKFLVGIRERLTAHIDYIRNILESVFVISAGVIFITMLASAFGELTISMVVIKQMAKYFLILSAAVLALEFVIEKICRKKSASK